jgi:hypothetical protein
MHDDSMLPSCCWTSRHANVFRYRSINSLVIHVGLELDLLAERLANMPIIHQKCDDKTCWNASCFEHRAQALRDVSRIDFKTSSCRHERIVDRCLLSELSTQHGGKLVSFMWKNCRKDVAITFDFYTNSRIGCCSLEERDSIGCSIRRAQDMTSTVEPISTKDFLVPVVIARSLVYCF